MYTRRIAYFGGDNMTKTTEPCTIEELREVAEKLEKVIFEEDLTVEETLIVLMMMRETAAANLAARAVMDKIQVDMKKVAEMVEAGGEVKLVQVTPPTTKKTIRVMADKTILN